jgi:hypothetical protein
VQDAKNAKKKEDQQKAALEKKKQAAEALLGVVRQHNMKTTSQLAYVADVQKYMAGDIARELELRNGCF